ncbi:MAG: TIGR03790 family protein [Kiritimatiellia bacterium]
MPPLRPFCRPTVWVLLALLWTAPRLFAGGGPFNVLVVVNTNSADSVELGAYYAEKHGIPSHHVCSVGIATNLATLTTNEFYALLRNPITNHIVANGLSGQIDYLVLCQEFPTRINNAQGISASLFYGPRYGGTYGCYPPTSSTSNEYYRAERAFRSADGWSSTNGFVAFHLISSNLATSKLVVDRGAAAQSSFPSAAIYLYMLGDQARGIREQLFANTQFTFSALPGLPASCVFPPLYELLSGKTNVVGYHDGYPSIFDWVRTNNVWMDGAYADHLTSYGGTIPPVGQSTVLDWMQIGATASFGTVNEPCAYLEKFPDPLMGFFYARGFTIGEAYAMSVLAPYQGLFAGDPLAAPFAAPPAMTVTSPVPYQIVAGTVPVQVSAAAHSNGVPAARLDLYLDERLHANLAALAPTRFNKLSVVVGTRTNTATVGMGDSLFDAVEDLADAVNADPLQIVSARARGDRLELVYTNFNHAGDNVPVSASVSTGTASVLTLGVGLAATHLVPSIYPARTTFYLRAHTNGAASTLANAGDEISCTITLTNGVAVTNLIVATAGERITNLLERLRAAIVTNETLMATNGVRYDRLARSVPNMVDMGCFFAQTPGPDGAGIFVDYVVTPVVTNWGLRTNYNFSAFLRDWPDDVRPRASALFHVKPSNGVLSAATPLDTTTLSDGLHALDFVARDGSAVAAQSRLTLPLFVANTSRVLAVSSAYGTGTPAAGTHFYPPSSVLTNSISAPAAAGGTQLVCVGWSMDGNDPTTGSATNFTMTLTNHASLVWLWTTNYWLDTAAAEHGSVNVADAWQPGGATTQITALADAYYHFTNWTGSVSSTNNPLDLLIDAPKTVLANFAETLAASNVPHWWLAAHGWTNDFDAAATNDAEPDGFFTWQEYVADTDPTNSASYPKMTFIETWQTNSPILTWPASTGRFYEIHWCDDIVVGQWTFLPLGLGSNVWTDTNPPPATNRYYRIAPSIP